MSENIVAVKSAHWAKQLYYYIVLFVSILFVAIGTYWLLESNLKHWVFTALETNTSYYGDTSNCGGYNKITGSPMYDTNSETYKKCIADAETEGKKISYQQDMLNSILMVVIAGVVLGLHLKYMRPEMKDTAVLAGVKKVAKK